MPKTEITTAKEAIRIVKMSNEKASFIVSIKTAVKLVEEIERLQKLLEEKQNLIYEAAQKILIMEGKSGK
jgi:thymidylate synthase ThyX